LGQHCHTASNDEQKMKSNNPAQKPSPPLRAMGRLMAGALTAGLLSALVLSAAVMGIALIA